METYYKPEDLPRFEEIGKEVPELAKKFFESCLQLSPDTPDKAYIKGYLKQCTLSEES